MEENINNEININGSENEVFVPRFKDSMGTTANRRRIKILQQVGDEMIVEITNETTPTERGTALTAEMMNEFDRRVFDSEKNSASAKSMAESAEEKARQALQHASDNRGTMIYAGGELKQSFNMDDKADKQTTNQALENLSLGKADKETTNQSFVDVNGRIAETNQNVSNLSARPVFTEIGYDGETFSTEKNYKVKNITVTGNIVLS